MIAARQIFLGTSQSNAEEEMYKELYEALVARSIVNATGNDVTSIGKYAFNSCTSLVNANFPSATLIDSQAFQNCNHLESISADAALTIGGWAFQNNSALTDIYMPSVTSLGQSCFEGCDSLVSVSFPAVTLMINGGQFNLCSNLVSASFPAFNSGYIGGDTFRRCYKLESLNFLGVNTLYSAFTDVGRDVATKTDSDGNSYKTLITFSEMTASALLSKSGFPGNAPTTTKFQCSDGYIIYDNSTSAWKAVTTWQLHSTSTTN